MPTIRTKAGLIAAALIVGTAIVAVGEEPRENASLYSRLGGYDVIASVVDDFFERFDADPTLAPFLGGISTDSSKQIRQYFVDFFCARTGGPCLYTGRDMRTTHDGLKITNTNWQATVGHLGAAMDSAKVGPNEKQELLTLVGTLKKHIVAKP